MLEILAIQETAKAYASCFLCNDPAINHCVSCDIFMCKKCSESHYVWPTHKNHDVLPVEELSNPESKPKIRKKLCGNQHKDKVLEIYCETCKELCCIHCMFSTHLKQNHTCGAVNEVAQKEKETLQSSCTTLDEKLSEGKEALNNICEMMKSLEKNAEKAKYQIKKQKENILKIVAKKLDEKVKEMIEEVDEVYGKLQSELSKQLDEIREYLNEVQASMSLPRNLLKKGSIEEILSSQKLIDEKIKNLGNEKPKKLDPINDDGIQYVPDVISQVNVDEIVDNLGYVEGKFNLLRNYYHRYK